MSSEQPSQSEEEIKEYLNTYVMPSLLPAVEALLKEKGFFSCFLFHGFIN